MEDQEKQEKGSRKPLIITIAVAVIVLFLAVGGVFLWQNRIVRDKDQELDELRDENADLQNEVEDAEQDADNTVVNDVEEEDAAQDEDADDEPAVSEDEEDDAVSQETVVVYQPGGLFTKAMKTELEKKLINPLVDFEETSSGSDHQVVSITVEIREGTPEYLVEAIYSDGGSLGMLYGMHADATQPWYVPGCKGGCPFTNEYKAKYPEVVAQEAM